MSAADEAGTVSALRRGVAVLQCFGAGNASLSNAELSRLTGVPKPTVTRLASTLVALGLLRQDMATEKFSLGAGVLSLAHAFLSGFDIRASARPHLQRLAEETGGTAYLAVRDAGEMVIIDACRARAPMLTMSLGIGSRVPLGTSSLGRACLAGMPAGEREALVGELGITGFDRVLHEADVHRYCTSLGELRSEIHSLATSLCLPTGEVVSLNCGGPAFTFPESRLREEVGPRLLAAARTLALESGATLPLDNSFPQSKAA